VDTNLAVPRDAELDAMQWVADPHADETVAAILANATPEERARRVDALNAAIRGWQTNAAVRAAAPDAKLAALGLEQPLVRYLGAAQPLPAWAQPERIARAEAIFMDYGALSVTMLFCASLPECYVVPDLAAVLHATGQLEDRAEHRIRTTGAMIFPVMMHGGLTQPDGAGIAQILKVRLIHATIRNLILRGPPGALTSRSQVLPLAAARPGDSMTHALGVHGWDLARCGLPNNQEELAYTLLTFSYVFLRSMRRLGIPLTAEQEEDYLHAWNVAGHFLGIRRELMVDTMDAAAELFARMQARGRAAGLADRTLPDARPHLAAALMNAMKSAFPHGMLRDFPVLLTRRLLEPQSCADLGLDAEVSWVSRTCFAAVMSGIRAVDAVARLAFADFSLSRLVTRAVGYRLTCALLMSQTRELAVPSGLRPGIRALIARWGHDRHASTRMNALEDRVTTEGDWEALERPAP
jgi:hypothetical protein